MNLEEFTHDLTTPELERVNKELALLLSDEHSAPETHAQRIQALSEQRDHLVKVLLSELQEPDLSQFAQAEYKINQKLAEMAQSSLYSVKSDIVRFVRSQKAVKRYK